MLFYKQWIVEKICPEEKSTNKKPVTEKGAENLPLMKKPPPPIPLSLQNHPRHFWHPFPRR